MVFDEQDVIKGGYANTSQAENAALDALIESLKERHVSKLAQRQAGLKRIQRQVRVLPIYMRPHP